MCCVFSLLRFCIKDFLNCIFNKYVFRQTLLVIVITSNAFLFGADISFPATWLPQNELLNSTIFSHSEQAGIWLTSISSLTAIPGTILGAILVDRIGRKWTYIWGQSGNAVGWCLIATTYNNWQIYPGRAIHGFHKGVTVSATYCFITETTRDTQTYTAFLNMLNIGTTLGILFIDLTGFFKLWRLSAIVLVVLSAINLLILLYLHDTHVWYLQRYMEDKGNSVYFWYRKQTHDEMKNYITFKDTFWSKERQSFIEFVCKKEWTKRVFFVPFLILFWFVLTITSSAGYVSISYSEELMHRMVSIDPYRRILINDVLRVGAALGTVLVLKHFPKQLIVIISSVMCFVFFLLWAASKYWTKVWDGLYFVSAVCSFAVTVFYNIGFTNMFVICLGQLFSNNHVCQGTAIVSVFMFAFTFGEIHLVPFLFIKLGNIYTILVFVISLVIGGIGLFFILPDNQKKYLKESNEEEVNRGSIQRNDIV